MSKGIGGHLRRAFVRGLFVLIPVVLTYMVLKLLFDIVDGVLQPLVEGVFGNRIPGLGLLFLAVLVYLTGLLVANVLGRRIVELLKGGLLRIPVVSNVYSTSGKLIDSFSGSSDMGFKRVVAIEHPRRGAWTLGFLTSFIDEAPSKPYGHSLHTHRSHAQLGLGGHPSRRRGLRYRPVHRHGDEPGFVRRHYGAITIQADGASGRVIYISRRCLIA